MEIGASIRDLRKKATFHIGEHSSKDGWCQVSLQGVEVIGDDGDIPCNIPFGVIDTVDGVGVILRLADIGFEWDAQDGTHVSPDALYVFQGNTERNPYPSCSVLGT